jgi:hypothetical protein
MLAPVKEPKGLSLFEAIDMWALLESILTSNAYFHVVEYT